MTANEPLISRAFDERNRLWSIPALAGVVALLAFAVRGGEGYVRAAVETVVAVGIGFLLTAGWTIVQDLRANLAYRAKRRSIELKLHAEAIETLNHNVSIVTSGLKNYLVSKREEGVKVRTSLIDLDSDVVMLKRRDPAAALRPQLSAIADKFGELAGVRAVVANLSSKMKCVEEIANQVREVEQRVERRAAENEWAKNLGTEIAALKADIAAQLSKAVSLESVSETALGSITDEFRARLADGASKVLESIDPKELAAIMGEDTSERFENIDRRMNKLSGVVQGLQAAFEEQRFAVGADGVASIFRTAQGIDMRDPANQNKAGALAKIFQMNLKLQKVALHKVAA